MKEILDAAANPVILPDIITPTSQLINRNLDIIAICGSFITIQQKPMCRTIFVKWGQEDKNTYTKNYYLAFPHMIYIINKQDLYIYFAKESITNLNQMLYRPVLLNIDDLNHVCQPFSCQLEETINLFWNTSFTCWFENENDLNINFYPFSFQKWDQLTNQNPQLGLEHIQNREWREVNTLKNVLHNLTILDTKFTLDKFIRPYKDRLKKIKKLCYEQTTKS